MSPSSPVVALVLLCACSSASTAPAPIDSGHGDTFETIDGAIVIDAGRTPDARADGPRDGGFDSSALPDALAETAAADRGPLGDANTDVATDATVSDANVCPGLCDPTNASACVTGECVIGADGASCSRAGTGHEGDVCLRSADCAAGLGCFEWVGAEGASRCGRLCCTGSLCALGERCETSLTLVEPVRGFGRCVATHACDVLSFSSCDLGLACYIVSSRGETQCRSRGTVPEGGGCSVPESCEPGLVCAGVPDAVCQRICQLTDAGGGIGCNGRDRCVAYPYSPPGSGVCTSTEFT